MLIQIFGTLKCRDTQKAIRYFKERKVQTHFVDLNEKAITKGELENISRFISIDGLIDRESKEYKKKGLDFMVFDIKDALLESPLLFKTPIVRNGKTATIGYEPEKWKNWLIDLNEKLYF